MPLPPALLAKLQKRGLVGDGPKAQEEVFVESHDDQDEVNPETYEYQSRKRFGDNLWMEKLKRRFKQTKEGVIGCPNKWNVFHVCTVFCLERWGQGTEKPSKSYKDRFQRLLEKYPLPKKGSWVYIWDPGCEAYYFWNKDDNLVSWLPPSHKKAVLSKSAAVIRSEKDRIDMDAPEEIELTAAQMMPPPANRTPPTQNEDRYQKPIATKKTKSRDLEKILRTKKGRRQFYENSDVIDPMDPASYGECGKGRWSSGLANPEDKSADSTASGPLFQMRPYPSPGDVLRAQGKRKEESPDKSDEEDDEPNEKQRRFSDEME